MDMNGHEDEDEDEDSLHAGYGPELIGNDKRE